MAGKIFINYRRGDDQGSAGRLHDHLLTAFAPDQLFMDVDNIAPGHDFVQSLNSQVEACDVFLAVVGRGWIDAKDALGRRRLGSPDDFVTIEIEAALSTGKRVIPVLINEAKMPRPEQLPEKLKPFARRNARQLRHERFRSDAAGLIKDLTNALEEAGLTPTLRNLNGDETTERAKERARLAAIQGVAPEEVKKTEELANWEFIKNSVKAADFRDHLARFSDGPTQSWALARLETVAWNALGSAPLAKDLKEFLREFPDGAHAGDAKRQSSVLSSLLERRISRRFYWLSSLITLPVFAVGLAALVFGMDNQNPLALAGAMLLVPAWLLAHWRAHDYNNGSEAASVIILLTLIMIALPFLMGGPMWRNAGAGPFALVACLFGFIWLGLGLRRGTVGPNRFGPDPSARRLPLDR